MMIQEKKANRIRVYAYEIQSAILHYLEEVESSPFCCTTADVQADGDMLLFTDEKVWQKFIDIFEILGLSFATGEPDKYEPDGYWYVDFEFSDGVVFR